MKIYEYWLPAKKTLKRRDIFVMSIENFEDDSIVHEAFKRKFGVYPWQYNNDMECDIRFKN